MGGVSAAKAEMTAFANALMDEAEGAAATEEQRRCVRALRVIMLMAVDAWFSARLPPP